ncbi:Carboxypeptidase Q [Smittium mucronatum]|uniref:Peptide hydrolase n=1 Tax=Smittium mucronatum TaxID=133383 RepID=A0A1R0H7D4_9FUNG|nr:Carboxypeptidase Q [Smittium mucronatum]
MLGNIVLKENAETVAKASSVEMINTLIENVENKDDTSIWDSLAEMTDLYGHRMTGHVQYDRSVSWVMDDVKLHPELTAWEEPVTVNIWNRNAEYAKLYIPTRSPPEIDIPMLGSGQSIGTGPEGIEADVIPVKTFEDLEKLGSSKITGNMVLFCADFVSYAENAKYRISGPLIAEKYGAVAVLVQSITGYSLMTPHTGAMYLSSIPSASITIEDSKLIERMYTRYIKAQKNPSIPNSDKFVKPRVKLVMNAESFENAKVSSNIIIDLKGSEKPDEIVLLSGHFDSWDVGVGALDDGGGAFSGYGALKMIANLPIRPSRTIRVIMWNNEETLFRGMHAYVEAHKDEIKKHVFAMESDMGNFNPWGMQVMGSDDMISNLKDLGKRYLSNVGGGNVTKIDHSPTNDISALGEMGVTLGGFESLDKYSQASPPSVEANEGYYRFYHSHADRMEALDKDQLRANAAAIAVWAYIIANQ